MAMNRIRALAIALPLGALAMIGGSVAFAQSGDSASPTPSAQTTPAPTTPGAPATPGADKDDCPNKDGAAGGTGSSTSSRPNRGGAGVPANTY